MKKKQRKRNQSKKNESKHYSKSRKARDKVIDKFCGGDGDVIDSFVVDRNHKDGKEIHCITTTGIIIIYNYETKKLVTKLIARPQQIERYYNGTGKQPPKYILEIAKWHEDLMYNYR